MPSHEACMPKEADRMHA